MNINVDELNITNVSHRKHEIRHSMPMQRGNKKSRVAMEIDIFFEINGFKYRLYVRKYESIDGESNYAQEYVRHEKGNERCSFCGKTYNEYIVCDPLTEYDEELFAHLKTFNSIRLEWLFLT